MKPLAAVGLLAVGALLGVCATAVHRIAWGLPLGMLATLAVLVALPAGWWTRLPFALGWVGVVAWLSAPRAEGDYVIGTGPAGYALLATALGVLVTGIATLPRAPRNPPRAPPPAPPPPS